MPVYSQIKKKRNSTTGRSMVEMIAVLAIMGILSLGALSGVNYVKDRNVANQILKEALTQASEIQTTHRIKTETNSLEIRYGQASSSEYIRSRAFTNNERNKIVLRAFNVSEGVCKKIVSAEPVEIFNCITLGKDTSTCDNENNNVSPDNCDNVSNDIAFIADAKVREGSAVDPCSGVNCTGRKVCLNGFCVCPSGTIENEDGECVNCPSIQKTACNIDDSWDSNGCQIWEHLDCSPDDCDQSTGKCCDSGETYYKEIEACCLSDQWAWTDNVCCNATVTTSGLCCKNETQSEACCKELNDDTAKYADGVCCSNGQIPSDGRCCSNEKWAQKANKCCLENEHPSEGYCCPIGEQYNEEINGCCKTGYHVSNGVCCPTDENGVQLIGKDGKCICPSNTLKYNANINICECPSPSDHYDAQNDVCCPISQTWSEERKSCVPSTCTSNTDCGKNYFCAFEFPTGLFPRGHDIPLGPGYCWPITKAPKIKYEINGYEWYNSHVPLTYFSSKSWCDALGLDKADMTMYNEAKTEFKQSALSGYHWLSGQALVMHPSGSGLIGHAVSLLSGNLAPRPSVANGYYPLCRGKKVENKCYISGCIYYDPDKCECLECQIGYTLSNDSLTCQPGNCKSNDDCDEEYFCLRERFDVCAYVSNYDYGDIGSCALIDKYEAIDIEEAGKKYKFSIKKMNYPSVENWCRRHNYVVAANLTSAVQKKITASIGDTPVYVWSRALLASGGYCPFNQYYGLCEE